VCKGLPVKAKMGGKGLKKNQLDLERTEGGHQNDLKKGNHGNRGNVTKGGKNVRSVVLTG